MNDKLGFSIGTTVNPYSNFKPLPDWVAFDLCKVYPVPGGNMLLHNTINGKRCMIQPEVYATLMNCIEFRTIDQHTASIIERNPGMKEQKPAIDQMFLQMLKAGMLVSGKATCDRLKTKPQNTVMPKTDSKPVAAIITWERPQALERLLESIAKNCETKHIHRLYVIDDSRNPENVLKNREVVENFASRMETPLHYFGQDEQNRLIDGLVEKLPEHENAIRFLTDQSRWREHWTAGLSRNLALLLSCGRRLVMLDDDAICDVFEPPNANPKITFSDSAREADFFANEQEWTPLHQPINPDPIQRHMQCLGLTFSEAVDILGENHLKPAGLNHATALLVSELEAGSPILVTECGSLGCPGSVRNTWLPDMAPTSLKRMLKSEQKTTQALTSRKVWHGRNHPHFAPRSNMSQITGFDNRQMLPPYLPIMRGQDRLFGHMLSFIFPSAVTLDYPWAVPHLPLPERQWQERDRSFKPADSFPSFFFEKILEHKTTFVSDSALDRMASLSAWFRDMAAATDKSLISMYREDRLLSSSSRLNHLEKLMTSAASTPVNWQNYLRNGIKQLNTDLDIASREDFPVKGFPQNLEGSELIAFWKNVWLEFADTLTAWPEIREAATAYFKADQ